MKCLKQILLFSFLTFLINGCKDNLVDNSSSAASIKKVFTSDEDYSDYYYEGNLLIKKEITARGELVTSITFAYDNNGKLIRKDEFSTAAGIPLSDYSIYEYSVNNLLLKANHYPKIGDTFEFRGYTQYEYESNKLVKYSFFNQNDELRNYHILKYDEENIIEDAQYDDGNILQYLETFEYDDKLNPLIKDLSFISAFTRSKNNIIKWTNTYYTVNPPNIYISTCSYTYNDFSYPIKCITVYNRNEFGATSQDTTTSFYEYY
jgi:hypothetical protein